MAIKGKRKSKGGASRHRPGAPPRPSPATRRKPPWYKTTGGRIVGGLVLLALAILVFVLVGNARDNASDLEARQDDLETFTDGISAAMQQLYPPLSSLTSMLAGPRALPEDAADRVEETEAALLEIQSEATAIVPAPSTESASRGFLEAIGLYVEASTLLRDSLKEGPAVTATFADHVVTLIQKGDAIWAVATSDLDAELADAELEPSGFGPPASTAAQSAPPSPRPSGSPTKRGQRGDDSEND